MNVNLTAYFITGHGWPLNMYVIAVSDLTERRPGAYSSMRIRVF